LPNNSPKKKEVTLEVPEEFSHKRRSKDTSKLSKKEKLSIS
jgi:hypothetical protein